MATYTSDSLEDKFWFNSDNFESPTFSNKKDTVITNNNFTKWVKQIEIKVQGIVNIERENGDRGNLQVLRNFLKEFMKITIPQYTYHCRQVEWATIIHLRKGFNQIKNRLLHDNHFVMDYINRFRGDLKLTTANIRVSSLLFNYSINIEYFLG